MRELLLVADVSSGALRATEGLVIQNAPGIEPADPSRPELGQVYRLQENQTETFSFSFSLPDGSSSVQLEIAASNPGGVQSKMLVAVNGNTPREILVDNRGKLATFDLDLDGVSSGPNLVVVQCNLGDIGLQSAKVAFEVALPSITVQNGRTVSLIEPLDEAVLSNADASKIRWSTTDDTSEVYVTAGLRGPDGYVASLPSGVAVQSTRPGGAGFQGDITWNVPSADGSKIDLVIEAFSAEPKQFGELMGLTPRRSGCVITDDCRHIFAPKRQQQGVAGYIVEVYNTASGALSHEMLVDDRRVAISPNGRYLFSPKESTSSDGSTKITGALHEVATGNRLKEFEFADDDPIHRMFFTSDGQRLIIETFYKSVAVVDLGTGVVTVPTPLSNKQANALAVSPNGKYLACELFTQVGADHTLTLINLFDNSVVWQYTFGSGIAAFSREGDVLCVQQLDLEPLNHFQPQRVSITKLFLLDVLTGALRKTVPVDEMKGVFGEVGLYALEFFAEGKMLLSCEVGGTPPRGRLCVRDINSGKITAEFDLAVPQSCRMKISPNSRFVVAPINDPSRVSTGEARAIHILKLPT